MKRIPEPKIISNEQGFFTILFVLIAAITMSTLIFLMVEKQINMKQNSDFQATIALRDSTSQFVKTVVGVPSAILASINANDLTAGNLKTILTPCLGVDPVPLCTAYSATWTPATTTELQRGIGFNLYLPTSVGGTPDTAVAGMPIPSPVIASSNLSGVPGYAYVATTGAATGNRCDMTNANLKMCVLEALVTVERPSCTTLPCTFIFREKMRYNPNFLLPANATKQVKYLSFIEDKDDTLTAAQLAAKQTFQFCYQISGPILGMTIAQISPTLCP